MLIKNRRNFCGSALWDSVVATMIGRYIHGQPTSVLPVVRSRLDTDISGQFGDRNTPPRSDLAPMCVRSDSDFKLCRLSDSRNWDRCSLEPSPDQPHLQPVQLDLLTWRWKWHGRKFGIVEWQHFREGDLQFGEMLFRGGESPMICEGWPVTPR